MSRKVLVLAMCIHLIGTQETKSKFECGYKQCPPTREGALNVHLIAHSHMDAGWVKTFDEYYYGTRTAISTANVQLIYHSVLSELLHDKRRKFTFSETAFFWRWWKEQRPATRATFRTLVQEGRIEFAGGGWVQNDEATLDYLQIIDHYTWGLRKLNDTLGPCGKPKAAWQIDSYGHTREQASLLAQMGFDGLVIGRVDYKQKEAMIEEDRMEFMWRGSDVLGQMSDIMTHTLFNLYNAPDGFCFDFLCNDEPIVDDPDNRVYNAEKRVQDFINKIERQARYYEHDNILVTMGGDFTFQSAANWYMNMDKLINHVNTHPGNISDVNIFYSTPSCYLKAIYLSGRRDKAIYTEKDDLLPYGSNPITYWVGFYTSRPNLKFLVKRAHEFLQVVKQLSVMANAKDSFDLHLLRHAVNLLLHHDAITGTSQQHVTNDYVRTLSEAMDACTKKVSTLLSNMTPTWGSRRTKINQQFVVCHELNISQCWIHGQFTETQEPMLLIVYNPQSVKAFHHVCIPATALHYTIKDYNDEEVQYQVVPLSSAVINLPGRISTAIQQLCFEAENIPPLGYTSFYVVPLTEVAESGRSRQFQVKAEEMAGAASTIHNEFIKVTVNHVTGLLESISHMDGFKIDVTQNFYYYSQTARSHQSGAYSFRPDTDRPTAVTNSVRYHVVNGPLVKEINQRFSDWITQIIRLYRGQDFIEFDWIVGPVPIGKDLGKEVVSLFRSNITNEGYFYTDSNGREMLKRSCWNQSPAGEKKSVAACYHPVTSRICIQSLNKPDGMCVLTDRAQGGTSYNEGEIELMVHRRLFTDDGFGLEEPLNEEIFGVGLVVKGTHRIVFGNFKQDYSGRSLFDGVSAAARRWRQQPWLFLTSGDQLNRRRWQNVRNKRYSLLRPNGLPEHVHIITLEPWKAGSVLLRLENALERSNRDSPPESVPAFQEEFHYKSSYVAVNLRDIFIQRQIKAVRETTLAGNQWLDDARQMDWSTRYMYNGSDDDILREDLEMGEDKVVSDADSKYTGIISEENYFTRKKSEGKNSFRERHRYDRRKRWINYTAQILTKLNENSINGAVKKDYISLNMTADKYMNATHKPPVNKSTNTSYNVWTKNVLVTDDGTRRVPKKRRGSKWGKSLKYYSSLLADSSSEEIASGDEEAFKETKKRSNRKRNMTRHKTPRLAEPNDDITRSMFEMYYKPIQLRSTPTTTGSPSRKTNRNIKNSSRLQENGYIGDHSIENGKNKYAEIRLKKKRSGDGMFVLSSSPSRGTGWKRRLRQQRPRLRDRVRTDRPRVRARSDRRRLREPYVRMYEDCDLLQATEHFRSADKRQGYGAGTHSSRSEELSDDDDDGLEDTDGNRARRKRSESEHQPTTSASQESEKGGEPEPDYVITLRPTQIRTFVIWFHP